MNIAEWLDVIAKIGVPIIVLMLGHRLSKTSVTSVSRRSKALAEMEFLTSFLSFDLSHRPRIIVEQAFAVHFNTRYDFDQIRAVMGYLNPYRSLLLLSDARDYIELSDSSRFQYKEGYSSERVRRVKSAGYVSLYFISFLIPLAAFMYQDKFIGLPIWTENWSFRISFYIIALALVIFAFSSLMRSIRIKSAEDFMQEQEKSRQAGFIS